MEDHGDVPGVRVTVRLRPLNTKELGEGQTVGWQYNNKTILDDTGQGKKSFNFDSVLGPDSNNDQAYEDIAAHLVEKSLDERTEGTGEQGSATPLAAGPANCCIRSFIHRDRQKRPIKIRSI